MVHQRTKLLKYQMLVEQRQINFFANDYVVIGKYWLSDGHENRGPVNLWLVEVFDTDICIKLICRMVALLNIRWPSLHNWAIMYFSC